MSLEDKKPLPKTGYLFTSTQRLNDRSPDFYGSFVDEDGKVIHLVGWKRDSSNEKPYIKMAINKHPKVTY